MVSPEPYLNLHNTTPSVFPPTLSLTLPSTKACFWKNSLLDDTATNADKASISSISIEMDIWWTPCCPPDRASLKNVSIDSNPEMMIKQKLLKPEWSNTIKRLYLCSRSIKRRDLSLISRLNKELMIIPDSSRNLPLELMLFELRP